MDLTGNKGQLAKWFGEAGYGFIKFDDRDVFVHSTSYLQGFVPEVGQHVRFDFGIAPNGKPPMAVRVRVVKSAKAAQAEKAIQAGLEALMNTQEHKLTDGTVVKFSRVSGAV